MLILPEHVAYQPGAGHHPVIESIDGTQICCCDCNPTHIWIDGQLRYIHHNVVDADMRLLAINSESG